MTYQEFLDIQYKVSKEEDYYCWVCASYHHSKEDEEKYKYYSEKQKKIADFKKKVLTEAIKNISKDFFK